MSSSSSTAATEWRWLWRTEAGCERPSGRARRAPWPRPGLTSSGWTPGSWGPGPKAGSARAGEPADDRCPRTGARRSRAVMAVAATARGASDAPAAHGRRALTLGLPVIAAVFVLLTVPFLHRPVDSWEWLNRSAAQSIVV